MTEIYNVGQYHIRTTELINCPLCEHQEEIVSWTMALVLLSIPVYHVTFAMMYGIATPTAIAFSQIYACFELVGIIIIAIFYPDGKCGMRIRLADNRGNTIKTNYHRFSGNTERDTTRIKKSIDALKLHATKLIAEDEAYVVAHAAKRDAERIREEKCHKAYQEIIEIVEMK